MRKVLATLVAVIIGLTFNLNGIAVGSTNQTVGNSSIISDDDNQPVISEAQARESLNKMFPDIMKGKDLRAEYTGLQNFMGKAYWQFRSAVNQPGPWGWEINATVDASTGEVTRMDYNPGAEWYRGKIVKLTREQALPIAQRFLELAHSDKVKFLTIDNTDQGYYYSGNSINMSYMFSWKRLINKIPVDYDGVSLGVDAVTGMVVYYNYNWHDCQFPQVDTNLSGQELTDRLLAKPGLCPAYVTAMTSNSNETTYRPAYILNSSAVYYDCHTGQGLNGDGSKIADEDIYSYNQEFTPRQDVGREENINSGKNVKPEVAQKAAEYFFKLMGFTGKVERSGGGSSSSGDGVVQEFWSYSISSGNRSQGDVQVEINTCTGKVAQFHQYNYSVGNSEKSIDYKQALDKANEMIQKINPDLKNQMVLHKQEWGGKDGEPYVFNFARLVNGIPGERESVRVEIGNDGQLSSYRVDWYNMKYPPITNIISPEKAREIYRTQQPVELAYVFPVQSVQTSGQYIAEKPILVYRSKVMSRIDAISGEMLGWRQGVKISVIPASPALSLLKENGLLPAQGIDSNSQITRKQVLKVLVRATGSRYYSDDQDIELLFTDIQDNDPDYKLIQKAVKEGILPNQGSLHPDAPINREELAIWLVNSLNYQDVAAIKNRIATSYADADKISPDKANYVGLAEGLGLLQIDENNCFRPQANVTWVDMANAAARLTTLNHPEY